MKASYGNGVAWRWRWHAISGAGVLAPATVAFSWPWHR